MDYMISRAKSLSICFWTSVLSFREVLLALSLIGGLSPTSIVWLTKFVHPNSDYSRGKYVIIFYQQSFHFFSLLWIQHWFMHASKVILNLPTSNLSPLFTFSTKSLGQDSPSVHLFSKTIGLRFTTAKIKLGEDSPSWFIYFRSRFTLK